MIDSVDTVTQPLPVTTNSPIRLGFASKERYDTVLLTQDLFSAWTVMQSWSGKFTNLGGGKIRAVESFEQGVALLREIERRRYQRGYERVE